MENKRTKLISVLLIVLCLSLCVGATYAYFTDSVKSSNNIIKTGKLDVTMEWANGTNDPIAEGTVWTDASKGAIFNHDLWEPGYTEVRHIRIKNVGNLAFKYKLVIVANGEVTELADVIDVYYFDPAVQVADRTALANTTPLSNLTAALVGMDQTANGILKAGESIAITLALKMQEDAGNQYKELSIGSDFSIQLYATQYTYESDAFDDQYDVDATFPNGGVTTPAETTTPEATTPEETTPEKTPPEVTTPEETTPEVTTPDPGPDPAPDPSIFTWQLNDDGSSYTVIGLKNPGTVADLVIPATFKGLPVTAIGDWAFIRDTTITSVTIPDGIITIGDDAFHDCSNLTGELIIPDSVTTIGDGAFYYCDNLTELTIGNSVTTIGDRAFQYCASLRGELIIPDTVTTIGNAAFYWCPGLTGELVIPNGVTTIDDWAFYGCFGLTGELIIPDSVTTIGHSVFYGCSRLTKITIPDSVTTIDGWTFANCSGLTEVIIPDSVTTIGNSAFKDCSGLTEVIIPDSVTTIGDEAFYYCTGLTNIHIPKNVTTIGANPFSNCRNLIDIAVDEENTAYQSINGDLYSKDGTLLVSYAIGKSDTNFTVPDSVTTIGDSAFSNCDSLTEITIPDSVTTIGYFAFSDCDSLTSVTFGNSVTTIGNDAFFYCQSLTGELIIPDSVTAIGYRAFYNCQGLTKIFIPDSVIIVGSHALYGASQVYCLAAEAPDDWDPCWYCGEDCAGDDDYGHSGDYDSVVWGRTGEEYTYIFDSNGGTLVEESVTSKLEITLPTPEKEGWYFGGWYDNSNFEGDSLTSPYYSATKHTLYAKWVTEEEFYAGTSFDTAISIVAGETYTINIKTVGENVFYVFTPTVDGNYTFRSSSWEYAYGRLYDSERNVITSSDAESEGYFSISYDMTAGETYYLEFGAIMGETGSFTVTVTKQKPLDEYFAEAEEMELNTSYTANIATEGQKVFYKFTPTADGNYVFSFNGWWAAYGRLYDSNKTSLTYGSNEEEGYFSISRNMTAGETYYLELGAIMGETGSFTVTVTKQKPLDEYFAEAEEMELNTSYTANIATEGQKVFYKFTPTADGNYVFSFNGWWAAYGRLYDSNRTSLAYGSDDMEGYFSISRNLTAGETYYLEVGAMYEGYTGSCTVAVTKQLSAEEYFASAKEMELNTIYPVNIVSGGQKAFYKFTPLSSGTYTFYSIGNYDTLGTLYDSNREEIASGDDSEGDSDFIITCSLEAGETYYLEARHYSEENTGSFNVTVTTPVAYTFETNGGGSISDRISATGITLPMIYKDGAIFMGWYDNAACEGNALTSPYSSATDCTLYAKWITNVSQATVMEADRAYTANITIGGQRVLYAFTANKSGTHTFLISGDFYPDGYLYDSDLNHAEYDNDSEDDFSISYQLEAGKTYYLVAKFYSDANTGSFDVTVISPFTYSFETNGGNTIEPKVTSTGFTLPTPERDEAIFLGWYDNAECEGDALPSWYRGTGDCTLYAKWMTKDNIADQSVNMQANVVYGAEIEFGGQKIIYAFIPLASGTYIFSANGDYDTYGYLYDSDLVELAHNDDGEEDNNFSISYQLEAGKTYYLMVRMYSSGTTGSFEVTVAKQKTLDEYFAEAEEMELNDTDTANITTGGQKACYKFTPEASGTYIFSASGDYDTYGYLYDSDLVELASNDDYNGSNFSISYQLEAGKTYYLMVRMYYSDATGSFDVTVTEND